jgi:hypothetical protein
VPTYLAPSINLATGQFATLTRYRTRRWFSEALDGIRMTLGLLHFVEPVIVHSEFLCRLD